MSKFSKIKRAKYMAPFISLKSYMYTKSVKIKTDKNNFRRLVKHNKKTPFPHIILSTYGSIVDPLIVQRNLYPGSTYHVFNSNKDSNKYPILRQMGKRYFDYDNIQGMVNIIQKAIRRKLNVVLYPEKYASIDGTTSPIPREIISLLKMLNCPILVCVNHGTYAYEPVWGKNLKNGRVVCELKELFSKEDLNNKDEDELYDMLVGAMYYDDYAWLKQDGITNVDKNRCEGIEHILYKCPQCLEENKMMAKGIKIHCLSCGKQWTMTEYGDMKASMDDTEYASLHEWFGFERDCVIEEIASGNYKNVERVRITAISRETKRKLCEDVAGIMWHNTEGVILKYNAGSRVEEVMIGPDRLNNCQINYNYNGKDTCIELLSNDTIYKVHINMNEISATKLMFASEEIYKQYSHLSINDKINLVKNEEMAVTVDVEELLEAEEEIESEIENAGKIVAVEYVDDDRVTSSTADKIRQSAETVETKEV